MRFTVSLELQVLCTIFCTADRNRKFGAAFDDIGKLCLLVELGEGADSKREKVMREDMSVIPLQ